MANHYRAVGFEVSNEQQFEELLDHVVEQGDEFAVEDGRMFCWSPVDGAQVWLLVDDDWNFRGCSPHFSGHSRVPLALTDMRSHLEFWEGSAHAWVNPQSNEGDSGEYPLLFQIPDFYPLNLSLQVPARVDAQMAAFAHELDFFADAAEFAASQTGETKFASQFIIPSGLFAGEDEPQPYGMFAGVIRRYERLVNPSYGIAFHHFEVETLGATFDVVAEDEFVSAAPTIGSILNGSFWMSGRVLQLPYL
jgi:hypothetical protein